MNLESLREALALELPYTVRPMPEQGRPASVMAVLGARPDGDWAFLLTVRSAHLPTHQGQIAFPGGMVDPAELALADEGSLLAALRETEEEVGIDRARISVAGALPPIWTPSGFRITPWVGLLDRPWSEQSLQVSQDEIAEVFWASLDELRVTGVYRSEIHRVGSLEFPIHVYQIGPHRIWGATGAMIKNLLDRLERV